MPNQRQRKYYRHSHILKLQLIALAYYDRVIKPYRTGGDLPVSLQHLKVAVVPTTAVIDSLGVRAFMPEGEHGLTFSFSALAGSDSPGALPFRVVWEEFRGRAWEHLQTASIRALSARVMVSRPVLYSMKRGTTPISDTGILELQPHRPTFLWEGRPIVEAYVEAMDDLNLRGMFTCWMPPASLREAHRELMDEAAPDYDGDLSAGFDPRPGPVPVVERDLQEADQ